LKKRRRKIANWYRQAVARKQYACTQCDTPITAHSVYERDAYAVYDGGRTERLRPGTIEAEHVHIYPPCATAYYCGK